MGAQPATSGELFMAGGEGYFPECWGWGVMQALVGFA